MPQSERSIFDAVLDRALPPADRTAALDAACEGDPAMRRRVEALLDAHERAAGFLETPAGFAARVTDLPEPQLGAHIGPYRLVRKLGEGGMGVVFLAEQERPVRRQVAVKVIRPELASPHVVARFEAERQALAMMDHANIAKVLDAGTTGAGRPYFVMELVEGVPITRYCDEQRMTVRGRLELFAAVCDAVQHAHQKGVIHRDLKPTNVIVTTCDGRAVPKVIDFGVAKAVGEQQPRLTDRTLHTALGVLVGTLEYMSPEQAALGTGGIGNGSGSAAGVDTRSDVYSLGVVLYELLTGTTPLDRRRVREAAFDEMLRLIRETEPPRPSTRLSSVGEVVPAASSSRPSSDVAVSRGTSGVRHLAGIVRGELDWIVMKCLERDRARRYGTASELADDVRRHLRDEPVRASPPAVAYAARKFIRRHRAAVVATSAVAAALLTGTALSTAGLLHARRQRADAVAARELAAAARAAAEQSARQARAEAGKAAEVSRFLQSMVAGARGTVSDGATTRPGGGADPTVREVLDVAVHRLDQGRLAGQPEVEAALRVTIGTTYLDMGLAAAAEAQFRAALDLQLVALGPEHPDIAGTLHQLGVVADERGDAAAAEAYLRRARDINRRHPAPAGMPDADVAVAVAPPGGLPNAARLVVRDGESEMELSADPSEAAVTLHDQAAMRSQANDAAAAAKLYGRALELYRQAPGERNSRAVATVMTNIGLERIRLGDAAGAEAMLREALARHREVWGARHPMTRKPLAALQGLLARRGDPEASRLAVELLHVDLARLDAELKVLPGEARLIKDRAFLLGRLGRTAEEVVDWETAMRLDPADFHPCFAAAAGRMLLGDVNVAQDHAREMFARFGGSDDPAACERLAKTLLLTPDADKESVAKAMELIDRALPRVANEPGYIGWYEITKALAEYRAGRFKASDDWANRAGRHVPSISFGDLRHPGGARLAILAMARHRLGDAAGAAEALAECERLWAAYPKPGEADLADGANRHVWEILLTGARRTIRPPEQVRPGTATSD